MPDIHIVHSYRHRPAKVWRAITTPELAPLWTGSGLGARPVGFSLAVGTWFQIIGQAWRGITDCEVLAVRAPFLLRYSWFTENGQATYVTYEIEPAGEGTRLTFDHAGFTGLGGLLLARTLRAGRDKTLATGLPALLDRLDDNGALRS